MPAFNNDTITGIPLATGTPTGEAGIALETRATITNNHLKNTSNPHAVSKSQVGLGNVANALQLQAANNLSDLANASTARTNLGLGSLAILSTVGDSQVSTGINASKIGTGSVSNTEYGYLDGLTSPIQSQLDAKASTSALTTHTSNTALHIPTQTGQSGKYLTTDGTSASWTTVSGGGSGTVTSVALTVPTGELSVSGSPVTASGTLAMTWAAQSANRVLASANGVNGSTPTFRSLVSADIPALDANKITSGTLDTARLPTGIDATKIGDGSISNTEFQYLDGLTGNVQTQINALSGGGDFVPLAGGTMTGPLDMGGQTLSNVQTVNCNGSLIATGYTSFYGDGINFGWLTSYNAGEFQSLSGGVPAPMFFDSSEITFRGSGYGQLAKLDSSGNFDIAGEFRVNGTPISGGGSTPSISAVLAAGNDAGGSYAIYNLTDISATGSATLGYITCPNAISANSVDVASTLTTPSLNSNSGTIDCNGVGVVNASTMGVSGYFMASEQAGLTTSMAIQDMSGTTHNLTFQGGILVSYTTT